MRPPVVPDYLLIQAVQQYATATAGQTVRRVTLTLADRTKRRIDVPLTYSGPEIRRGAGSVRGWRDNGRDVLYNGEIVNISGKCGKILRELVTAGSDPIPAVDLKRKVWDEYTDDRTLQNAVSKLRQLLREVLAIPESDDPIEVTEDGYRLTI